MDLSWSSPGGGGTATLPHPHVSETEGWSGAWECPSRPSRTVLRQEVCCTPDGHPHKPGFLNNLVISFRSRFERLGNVADLDEALTAQRQAVCLAPDDHSERLGSLNGLRICLRSRFECLANIADLNEAITTQQQAVRLVPDGDRDKPMYLTNLGDSL